MKIGEFEILEPLPELENTHAIAMLRPWVDVGSVGTVVLSRLERHFSARELGRLEEPGQFYDFTRYRPILRYIDGERTVTVPNTVVNYAHGEEGQDFLFVRMLEPHSYGERFNESVIELFKAMGVTRYILIGGMYDVVPHTRPLRVSGSLKIEGSEAVTEQYQIRHSKYEGPTSIAYMVSRQMQDLGFETGNLTIHLPQYVQVEEDLTGAAVVMKVLSNIYDLPEELQDTRAAEKQYLEFSASVVRNPELKSLVDRLESMYDAKVAKEKEAREEPPLSKPVEEFLTDMDKRFGQN
jgi:hypothetical protein